MSVLAMLVLLQDTSGKIEWEKDYDKGLARAKAEGLPMLLYFGADW